jgi:predicted glycosyltransferase
MVDILHPAHVHVFKNFIREMEGRGHEVMITAREKDNSVELLRHEGFDPVVISEHRPGMRQLAAELAVRSRRFHRQVRAFKPDVLTGIMGPTIALVGRATGTPSVVFYDTELARVTNTWVYPLASYVVTPRSYLDDIGDHQVRYAGYHELAYLHPNRFTPDPGKVRAAGLDPLGSYVFFRFVAFESSHDTHQAGMGTAERVRLIQDVARDHDVVVSSEAPLPSEIERYSYRGRVEDVHHVLAFARLTVGESATMASESAVLGTPAAYIATTDRGYIREQQDRYGLVHIFREDEFAGFRDRVTELLAAEGLEERSRSARERLLSENIDVTDFMVGFFEEHFAGGGR